MNDPAPPKNTGPTDWFAPAMKPGLGVEACLTAVIDEEKQKISFIEALRTNLTSYSGAASDSITALRQRVNELEQTLQFRLGMLSPDRPGAWFRENADEGGPFGVTVLADPVLRRYDPGRTGELRSRISSHWRRRVAGTLPFDEPGPCLWQNLLQLNAAFEQIIVLPGPWSSVRIDRLPGALPAVCDSPAIRAFLINVRSALDSPRLQLDLCYRRLLDTCNPFWDRQEAGHGAGAEGGRRGASSGRGAAYREELRQRRERTRVLSMADRSALRFMEFVSFPDRGALRKRYLDLARRLHPDCAGGDEEKFKTLTRSYTHLARRLERSGQE